MAWREEDWSFACDPAHMAGPMWMDAVHVQVMYNVAMEMGWRRVLEIGSFDGFSASAYVQAKIDAAVGELICVDRTVRPTLLKVLSRARDNWTVASEIGSVYLDRVDVGDLLVLDSDHDLATSRLELEAALRKEWPNIFAHDVGATQTHSPGPQWILAELIRLGWHVLVDELPREGMATHRGLMFATRERGIWERVSRVWPEGRVP
jgi:hypothetical protein